MLAICSVNPEPSFEPRTTHLSAKLPPPDPTFTQVLQQEMNQMELGIPVLRAKAETPSERMPSVQRTGPAAGSGYHSPAAVLQQQQQQPPGNTGCMARTPNQVRLCCWGRPVFAHPSWNLRLEGWLWVHDRRDSRCRSKVPRHWVLRSGFPMVQQRQPCKTSVASREASSCVMGGACCVPPLNMCAIRLSGED